MRVSKKSNWSHIRWIGGSPCAGKSTIARQLVETYDLTFYQCDYHWKQHTENSTNSPDSLLYQLGHMTPEEIFMRPVDEQFRTEIAVYQEEFQHILNDLGQLPKDKSTLAEGAALQPDLVIPLLSQPEHAIWIVPTEEFQRREYAKRDWAQGIVEQTTNPNQAFDNWMARDVLCAKWVINQVQHLQLNSIIVDGLNSIQDNYEIVQQQFNLLAE